MIPANVWAMIMANMLCQTLRPSEMTDEPVVQPPTLKEPVIIQRPTKDQGPYVRREGGNGRVSLVMCDSMSVSPSLFTSTK